MSIDKNKIAEYLSEYFGTFILVSIIFLASILTPGFEPFLIGFGIAGLMYVFSAYGKAHFNPIFTIASVINKKISILDSIVYILVQFIAVLSAYPLAAWIRNRYIELQIVQNSVTTGLDEIRSQLLDQYALTTIYDKGFVSLAFALEFLFAFVLVLIFLVVANNEKTKKSTGMAVGIVLFIAVALVYQVTGASFNPLRSLVPAIFSGGDALHRIWLYLIAPTFGSILAGLVYWFMEWINIPGKLTLGGKKTDVEQKVETKSKTKVSKKKIIK
jgi:aquaporin Z